MGGSVSDGRPAIGDPPTAFYEAVRTWVPLVRGVDAKPLLLMTWGRRLPRPDGPSAMQADVAKAYILHRERAWNRGGSGRSRLGGSAQSAHHRRAALLRRVPSFCGRLISVGLGGLFYHHRPRSHGGPGGHLRAPVYPRAGLYLRWDDCLESGGCGQEGAPRRPERGHRRGTPEGRLAGRFRGGPIAGRSRPPPTSVVVGFYGLTRTITTMYPTDVVPPGATLVWRSKKLLPHKQLSGCSDPGAGGVEQDNKFFWGY